ncbi:uncharacterized protein LOC129593737 [Paramacrobiotus metropolitanus]|uniref:uncharacterized protein LOC129593737 n=1 Tax=Paramacrobiotus metropolitanus TaxID=2943436 RepID=UPI0024457E9B|nr:uncharacterized protein LOC129593737 [Paramacrobiotus metropolitanus]
MMRFIKYLKPICWNWKLRTFTHFLTHFAKDIGVRVPLTSAWRAQFLDSHEDEIPPRIAPILQLKAGRLPEPVTQQEFFSVVEEVYRELNVGDKPESIWNFDTTSVMLPEPQKKVTKKRKHTAGDEDDAPKEEPTSVLYAVSAAGEHTPATILFRGVRIAGEWKSMLTDTDTERVQLMVNSYGEFDYPSAHKWLKNILMRSALPRPLVLFMDPLYSHLDNYEFIKQAFDDNIHLICIPPKVPTLKLPLGLTVMPLLKDKWYEDLDELQLASTPRNPLSRAQIVNALMPADTEALQEENIKAGFARCGLFPWNPHAATIEAQRADEAEANAEGPSEVDKVGRESDDFDMPPLSPRQQEAVNQAFAVFAQAGVSLKRAKRLLRNMNVPGFATVKDE